MLSALKNPALIPVYLYVFSAVITAVFKPRTPEQYAAMSPRVAAFLKTFGGMFCDLPKIAEGAVQLWKGTRREDPPK